MIAITGASAGIGRATALRVARDGAAVAICARRADKLDAVAAEIAAAGGQALAVPADVTHPDDMERFVERAIERFGRLDVMMCNAGYGLAGAIDDVTPAQVRHIMDVNYTGTYLAARAALRVFCLFRDEVCAGRSRRVLACGARRIGHSCDGCLSRVHRNRVLRCDVARDRNDSDAWPWPEAECRHSGPRDCARDRAAGAGSVPILQLPRPRVAERLRAGVL